MKKFLFWPILIVTLILIALGGLFAVSKFTNFQVYEPVVTESSSSVIDSISRKEQVVLLSLGIQGIDKKEANGKFFGADIPGSGKASFIQYTFNAKLGVEGKDVEISKIGEDSYRITIPKFIFIGHDDVQFELVAENKGILSFGTPEISQLEMVNKVLGPDSQAEYVLKHEDILREQAAGFYEAIVQAVDPSAVVTFDYK